MGLPLHLVDQINQVNVVNVVSVVRGSVLMVSVVMKPAWILGFV